jgi:hypothetical protein
MEECKAFAKSAPTLYTILLVLTDQFLEDCFSQYEVIQTDSLDSSNIEIFCFRQLLEYVIENLKSYRSVHGFIGGFTIQIMYSAP